MPDRVVTNADFAAYLDTSDQWIMERTGIRERRIAGPGETLTELCRDAPRSRHGQRRRRRRSGSMRSCWAPSARTAGLPAAACDLQALLGARNAAAFDIAAACPGWIFALAVAEGFIASGRAETVLALGAEKLSSVTDMTDRSTAVLFGDGAGAAVVQPATGDGRGILSIVLGSDGTLADLLYIPAGGSNEPVSSKVVEERTHYIRMAGREVFKAAVLAMARACDEALAKAGVTAEEIDLLVPHQANLRIIEATAKHAGMPMSKVMVNVDRYGNTSAASIPLAMAQARRGGADQAGLAPVAGDVRRRLHLGKRRRPMVSVLLFPGQGAQKVGMGKDLAERVPRGAGHLPRHRRGAGDPAVPHDVGGPGGGAAADPYHPARDPGALRRRARGRRVRGSVRWPARRATAWGNTARMSRPAR